MRVHGDYGGEIFDIEFPDGFGRAELFQHVDAADFFDALREYLRRAADAVQVNTTVLLAGLQRFVAHAAFADDAAQTEIANHLPLIRLLANGRRRAGSGAFPVALLVLDDYRAAVIENAVFEIHTGRQRAAFVQIFVHGIAAGEEDAGDQNFVADFEGADLLLGDWCSERNHGLKLVECFFVDIFSISNREQKQFVKFDVKIINHPIISDT